MKNWEVHEGIIKQTNGKIALDINDNVVRCVDVNCDNCKFSNSYNRYDGGRCTARQINWLYQEYQKPKNKISRATKIILENLDEDWKYLAKDEDGGVFAYANKPYKDYKAWGFVGRYRCISSLFKENLFNFLSWSDEEPTNIKELLENCEVID